MSETGDKKETWRKNWLSYVFKEIWCILGYEWDGILYKWYKDFEFGDNIVLFFGQCSFESLTVSITVEHQNKNLDLSGIAGYLYESKILCKK